MLASLVPLVVYGVTMSLSNLAFSRSWVVWKFVEFFTGAAAIYPACQIIEQWRPAVMP